MHYAKHMDALLYALHLPASLEEWWWADTYPNSNGYTDSYANTYSNADTNSNPNPYAHGNTHPDTAYWFGSGLQF